MFYSYLIGSHDVVLNNQRNFWMEASMEWMHTYNQECSVRLRTWTNPPFTYTYPVYVDQFENEFYQLLGPLYSLIKEIAHKVNCTLVWHFLKTYDDLPKQFIFMPHIDLYTITYSSGVLDELNAFVEASGMPKELFESTSLGYVNSDHVLYRKQQKPASSFNFLGILGWRVWLMIFANIFILPLICGLRDHIKAKYLRRKWRRPNFFLRNNVRIERSRNKALLNGALFGERRCRATPFYARYLHYFWQCAIYIFGSDQIEIFKTRKHLLLMTWIFAVYVLQSCFTGDMIGVMATRSKDLFIDSWDDLMARTDVDKIAVFNYKTAVFGGVDNYVKNTYFPPGKYQEMTERLEVYSAENLFQADLFPKMLRRVSKGEFALLYHQTCLELYTNRRPDLHLSKHGGFTEPYFYLYYSKLPQQFREVQDSSIVQLRESGIYEKWIEMFRWSASTIMFQGPPSPKSKDSVDVYGLKETKACFFILGYGCFFSILAFIGERLYSLDWRYIATNFKPLLMSTTERIELFFDRHFSFLFRKLNQINAWISNDLFG